MNIRTGIHLAIKFIDVYVCYRNWVNSKPKPPMVAVKPPPPIVVSVHEQTEGLRFYDTVIYEALRAGKRVTRLKWNTKNQWIVHNGFTQDGVYKWTAEMHEANRASYYLPIQGENRSANDWIILD